MWIPDEGHEGIRDLSRTREDAVQGRTRARQQREGFLLRHGVRYTGKTSWTKSYFQWPADRFFQSTVIWSISVNNP